MAQIGEGPRLDKIKSLAKKILNPLTPKRVALAAAASLAYLNRDKLAEGLVAATLRESGILKGSGADNSIARDFQALEAELSGQSGGALPSLARLKKIAQSILDKLPAGAKTLSEAIRVGKQLNAIRKQLSGTGRGAMRTSLRGGNGWLPGHPWFVNNPNPMAAAQNPYFQDLSTAPADIPQQLQRKLPGPWNHPHNINVRLPTDQEKRLWGPTVHSEWSSGLPTTTQGPTIKQPKYNTQPFK
tara:strand:- start:37 stop:765 length:729 start_codon:yes stop_codon:yes gene_type:complete